jgi:hypothetical protein
MACAGAPESLAEVLELETDSPVDFAMVVRMVWVMQVKQLKHPEIIEMPERMVKLEHLPLMDFPIGQKPMIKHLVDVVKDEADDFDRENIRALVTQGLYSELPGVLRPKTAIAHGYVMNFSLVPTEGGKCDIVKHYVFENSVPGSVAITLAQGHAMMINYGSNKKAGARPFMYMMQRMGGFAAYFFRLEVPGGTSRSKVLEKPDDINAAYDFIDDMAPRENNKNQQARWIDTQLNDPKSPIFSWTVGRIQNALRNLKEGGQHAESQEEYPLFFGHFEPWFQDVLKDIIPRLDEETMLWLGCPGAGKTVAQYIIGFAMARVHIWEDGKEGAKKPSCRVAPDFDCFKNEPGTKYRSTLFDDGDLDRMPPRKTKAFHDGKKKSGLSVERYISAKFVQKEFRSSADNKVDLEAEPCATVDGERGPLVVGYTGTTYDQLLAMIRPAFPKESVPSDMEAVLRRATVLVNTRDFLYVRAAGNKEDNVQVKRYPMKTKTFVTSDALAILQKWWKTGETLPRLAQVAMIEEEQKLFRGLLRSQRTAKMTEPAVHPSSDVEEQPTGSAGAIEGKDEGPMGAACAEDYVDPAATAGVPEDEEDEDVFGHGFGIDMKEGTDTAAMVPVKIEQPADENEVLQQKFLALKRQGPVTIDLDSSPEGSQVAKRRRASRETSQQ